MTKRLVWFARMDKSSRRKRVKICGGSVGWSTRFTFGIRILYCVLPKKLRYLKRVVYMSRDMIKPTKSSLSAWRKLRSLVTHWVHSEDSDQTGRMPRLIWVFAGRTVVLLVLSCRGSYTGIFKNKNQKWDPLRAMKTFIRKKVGHTT